VTPLTILFTNNTLALRAGTELYIRDLALELRARGHRPIAFSTILGDVAGELRAGGVDVIDQLDPLMSPPDLIHAHHHIETMMALLRFPDAPAIAVCHGSAQWEETPIVFPRILRHVAVDDACLARLRETPGLPESSIQQIFNFVDMTRFPSRPPLPPVPARAAVLNNEIADANVLPAIRDACERRGIALDVFGAAAGRPLDDPGSVLGDYDVVFGKARCALEGMAVGAAVILCAASGLGPLVTASEFDRLRRLNFGVRTLDRSVTPEAVGEELDRIDAADAARVSARIRTEASLTHAADQWEALYSAVLGEDARRGDPDRVAEGRAATDYLRSISDIFKAGFATHSEVIRLRAELATALRHER
jgi:hypothetical protein